jgi:ABC-type nitrate/sulfonate/bicarbonate transport system permease component
VGGCVGAKRPQWERTDHVRVETKNAGASLEVIALCAFAFSFAMRMIERWLVPWKGQN